MTLHGEQVVNSLDKAKSNEINKDLRPVQDAGEVSASMASDDLHKVSLPQDFKNFNHTTNSFLAQPKTKFNIADIEYGNDSQNEDGKPQ